VPNKITKVTPEQAARFEEWAERWIKIGLSTEPADFARATEAALKAYALCNLNRPMVILRMASPYAATLGGAIAWAILREIFGNKKKVGSQVESQVRSQALSQVWSQVESQVRSQVRSQVESQVGSQVGSQVWSQVRSQVRSQVWSQVESGISNDRGGAFWASWGACVSFIRDVLGWEDPTLERFAIDEALIESCGWVWWHENVLAISDRPEFINRDAAGRLHCEAGPSISYRDGWSLWHWHGVAVPQWIIEEPGRIAPDKIDAESNAEVRRVLIERFGRARYLQAGNAKLLAEDTDIYGRPRKLWLKEIRGDEPLVMIQVVNSTPEPDGSMKDYFLRVPPAMGTPQEAVAWTFGMSAEAYRTTIET